MIIWQKPSVKALFTALIILISSIISVKAANYLGWSEEQASNWQRMKNENHFLWQDLKAEADNNNIWDDDGLRDAMVYMITGDVNYAIQAYSNISHYAGLTKSGDIPNSRNETRHKFGRMSMIYHWIKDVLPEQDKADFRDILEFWVVLCTNELEANATPVWKTKWQTRATDSDETVGHYFGIVLYALAIQEEDPVRSLEILNYDVPGVYTPPVGGLDVTALDHSTMRNALATYAETMKGGQWIESTEYNLGTVQLLLAGIEAINNFLGVDKFPEFTSQYNDLANSFIQEIVPGFTDAFQWGDTERPHDLFLYRRGALLSMISGITKNPKALYLIWNEYYKKKTEGGVYLYADPYSARKVPEGTSYHHAEGRGVAFWRNGWEENDSFVGSVMYNPTYVDHDLLSLSNFSLWRKNGWALSSPLAYSTLNTAVLSNTLLVSGAFSSVKEARGEVAFDASDKHLYHAGTTGGRLNRKGFYNPPNETVHEWTRSSLYLHNDDESDTVIIFDRVDASNPLISQSQEKINRYDKYHLPRVLKNNGKHQWLIHMPETPIINGNAINWTASNGEEIHFKTFMSDYTPLVVDEAAHWSVEPTPALKLPSVSSTINEEELKYQLRLIPNSTEKWQTFLNIIHVGSEVLTEEYKASSGDKAVAIKVEAGTQNTLAIFNATQGPELAISSDYQFNPNKLVELKNKRLFKNGFNLNVHTDGLTQVYLMDLDNNKAWKAKIGDSEFDLVVAESGLAKFSFIQSGEHIINVSVVDDGSPRAVISEPQIEGNQVQFSSSESYNPDEGLFTYLWDFGDGNTSSDKSPSHTYSTDGLYTVTLTISNGSLTDVSTFRITIGDGETAPTPTDPMLPLAVISTPTIDGNTVQFISNESHNPDESLFSYLWNFGDGNTSSEKNPSHTFISGNTHIITLTIFNGSVESTDSVSITLGDINGTPTSPVYQWIEGETASNMTEAMHISSDSEASGELFVETSVTDSGELTYEINIPFSGEYTIWARVKAENQWANSFILSLDNGQERTWEITATNQWVWNKTLFSEQAGKVHLNQGKHILKFKGREKRAKIDKIFITSNPTFIPSGAGKSGQEVPDLSINDIYQWVEGESADSMVDAMYIGSDLDASGEAFVATSVADSGEVTYEIDVPFSGEYVIWGRVKAQNQWADSFILSLDGGDERLWNVEATDQWVWNKTLFSDQAGKVYLTQGSHTLIVKGGEKRAKIDKFLITGNLNFVPTELNSGEEVIIELTGDSYQWIEGESANSMIEAMYVGNDTGASGQKFVETSVSGSGELTYEINIPFDGEYIVWGRVKAENQWANSFILSLDIEEEKTWEITATGEWEWDELRFSEGVSTIYLSKGTHTITIKGGEKRAKIDKLLISSNTTFIPSGAGLSGIEAPEAVASEQYQWIEGESANSITEAMYIGNDSAASGEQFVETSISGSGELTYEINIPYSGEYIIWGRVKAENQWANSFVFSINDNEETTWEVTATNQWVWNELTFVSEVSHIYLSAGNNTITIKGSEKRTKLDKLLITSDLNFTPSELGE